MKKKLKHLLEVIETEAKNTSAYTGRKKFRQPVMEVLAEVDRENFVPEETKSFAYFNQPLPIGHGQTISQPYIVALMTDLLDLTPECIVLEIGTGSGYQTAILSRLAKKIYSIETVTPLYESATKTLKNLHYDNVETRCGDGYYGWQEKAPFDAIIVTAAASHIPPELIEQLKPGGRMVIPVGLPRMHQELMLFSKQADGTSKVKSILGVVFVPLVTENIDSETHNQVRGR